MARGLCVNDSNILHSLPFQKKGPTGSDPLLMACKSKAVLVKVAARLLTLNMFWFQLVICSLMFKMYRSG